jgi:hypothetical protein
METEATNCVRSNPRGQTIVVGARCKSLPCGEEGEGTSSGLRETPQDMHLVPCIRT